jgi:hypothetical protein
VKQITGQSNFTGAMLHADFPKRAARPGDIQEQPSNTQEQLIDS